MRKLAVPLLAAGVVALGIVAAPATADPASQSCRGQFVSTVVQGPLGPGRRAVAETFFGDDPHAVQTAEQFLQTVICPS